MWLLENENLFNGRKVWLKPGSRQLIGRTRPENYTAGLSGSIDNKFVSRKHLVISVTEVAPEDGTKLHPRSRIEITDDSKHGTSIDGGERFRKETRVLTGTKHTIQLGSCPSLLKITWHPVVLTYAFSEREYKQERERLNKPTSKQTTQKLHSLDIKTTKEFIFEKTTHVISHKRNLPKSLQGLLAGKHVVTPAYLDALIDAATSSQDDPENYTPSRLEQDFDNWWPNAREYVPPRGAEPIARPANLWAPDEGRSDVFSGLNFVFLDQGQYDNLADVVSSGGGKALMYDLRYGETTVEEYLDFVHSVAGGKSSRARKDDRLSVITVRLNTFPADMEQWALNFINGIERTQNQRTILQSEFLDPIIMKDTSALRRPPNEVVEVSSSIPTPSVPTLPQASSLRREITGLSQSQAQSQSQLPADSQVAVPTTEPMRKPTRVIPSKRPFRRGATASRFTGFDDYEEPPKKSRRIEQDTPIIEVPQTDAESDRVPESMEIDDIPRSPSVEKINESVMIDELMPATAAMKRRRLATRGPSGSPDPESGKKHKSEVAEVLEKFQKAKKKISAKEIDVREQTRLRIKAEEEARKLDEESLQQALEGVDISEIRGLVKIEEMEVRPRQSRTRQNDERSQRWDESWNGRKNFKKFRRRGAERGPQPRKIIVALEEVAPKTSFGGGIVDASFLEEPSTTPPPPPPPSRRAAEKQKAPPPKQQPAIDASPGEAGFTRRHTRNQQGNNKKGSQIEPVVIEDSDNPDEEEVFPEEIAGTPRNRRILERIEETQVQEERRVNRNAQSSTRAQQRKQSAVAESSTAAKRPAVSVAGKPPPAKKQRAGGSAAAPVRVDSDDGEEEMGFRFRRKRR